MKWAGAFAALPGAILVGCGSDDGSSPDLITLADFEGSWVAVSYSVTSVAIPGLSLEVISMGATFEWEADDAGHFTGSAFIPAALAGQDLNLDFQGAVTLLSQDSVVVNFNPEIPPFLTQLRGEFHLAGDVFTVTEEDSEFDFNGDGNMEAAIFEGTFERS